MNILKFFNNISIFRGIPAEEKNASSSVRTVPAEVVQLYYYSGAVRTIDAGQQAGVAVEGQLSFNNIKNASGDHQASLLDTSLAYTSGVFTAEVEFPYLDVENGDGGTGKGILDYVVRNFSNGQFCVDYSTGKLFGKKATTAVTLAGVTYKIRVGITASPSGAGLGSGATHAATEATVGDSASSVTLIAANASRTLATIRNDSTARLYICEGAAATTASPDYLDQGDIWTSPILAGGEVYRGNITGIWASDAGGSAYTKENV